MTTDDAVIRACRVCLSPTRTRERALACWFGHARRGGTPTSVDLSRIFAGVKRSKSRNCLAETLRDLDAAYRNAFAGGTRLPRFKSRHGAQWVRIALRESAGRRERSPEHRERRHGGIPMTRGDA